MAYLFQAVLNILTSLIVFIIFMMQIRYIIKSKTINKHERIVKYRLCGILWFLIASIFLSLLTSFQIYGNYLHLIDSDLIFHVFLYRGAWTAWSFGTVFCYLSFIRSLNVFENTAFKISDKLKSIFYTLIILFFILESCSTTCYILYYNEMLSLVRYETYHLIILILQEMVDFVLTLFLVKIFVKTLFSVTLTLTDDSRSNSSNLSSQQLNFVDLITKYNLLGVPAVLSTQLFLFCDLIFIIVILITNNNAFEVIADTRFLPFVWILECFTNVLCVFLVGNDSRFWYNCCCGKCHSYSKQKMEKKVSMQMVQLQAKLISDDL
eukprot:182883_1